MGNYNSQYESYYKSIVNTRSNSNNSYDRSIGKRPKGNPITRRIIQDLSGVLVMLLTVTICKFISIPQTEAIYKYSKEVVNTNFDYMAVVDKVRNIDTGESIQDKTIEFIDDLKTKIMGGETIKEKIRERFTLPANGNIEEENQGIKIENTGDGQVTASYNGRIKECGADSKIGNYIVIDHGNGIDTLYSNLDNILVKEKDVVKKGDNIAVNEIENSKDYVHFEVLFMGQNKGLEKIIRSEK